MPDKIVTGVAQASNGFLWAAGPRHLLRFDGVSFEVFPAEGAIPLQGSVLQAMIAGRDGFWLGLRRGGVVYLADGHAQLYSDGLPTGAVLETLLEDDEGSLWITYQTGEVYQLCRGKAAPVLQNQDGIRSVPCSIGRDGQGRLWFAKGRKAGVIAGGQLKELVVDLPSSDSCIAGARAGGAWVCSGQRLLRIDSAGRMADLGDIGPEFTNAGPSVMLEDRRGGVWIGSSSAGLFHFDGANFQPVPTSLRKVQNLMQDREDNLWVGTAGGGMIRVQQRIVRLEGGSTALPAEAVHSICEDTRGRMWAATQHGVLVHRENDTWKRHATQPNGRITSLAPDTDGGLWIGTGNRRIYRWHDDELTCWDQKDGVPSRIVRSIAVTPSGEVWIGMGQPDSLVRLRGQKLQVLPVPDAIHEINTFACDPAGGMWIGTTYGRLFRAADESLVELPRPPWNTQARIRGLVPAGDGALWILFHNEGLARWKDGRFVSVTSKHGLREDALAHMMFDGLGWVWFTGERGVFKVRESELNAVAAGEATSLHAGDGGEGEPRASDAFLGPALGNWRSRDGRLWMPMATALVIVDPARVREDLEAPHVVLKRVEVDGRVAGRFGGLLSVTDAPDLASAAVELGLSPTHGRVQFEFAALSYTAPENIRFRFRLEGLDADWIDAGTQRTISYARLAAGDYRFHVQASNGQGVWNTRGASASVTVAPFVWQTWWFRGLAVGAFATAVAAGVRLVSFRRLRRQVKTLTREAAQLEREAALERERARIARDMHDQVGASLTQIALLGELAQSQPAPGEQTARMAATARHAVTALDEIVWAVNPRNDTLASLLEYLGQHAADLLRSAGLRCRLELPVEVLPRRLPSDFRHHLFLVAKEALHNVIKHARATEVRLEVRLAADRLVLEIADDGRGFDFAKAGAGADGLRNMRQRAAELGGELEIESRPVGGTSVRLRVPWPQSETV